MALIPEDFLPPDDETPKRGRPKKSKAKVQTFLSDDDLDALQAEVDRQLDEEKRNAEKKRVTALLLKAGRAERDPREEVVEVHLELPPFACAAPNGQGGDIMIDGVAYMNNRTYALPRHRAHTLLEAMHRARISEEIAFGKRDPKWSYRERNPRLSATTGVVRF